ncbi:MAG: stalk domain-containing protein [Bacillota bacterium]
MPPTKPDLPRWKGLLAGTAMLALLLAPGVSRAGELLPDIKTLPPTEISLEVNEEGQHLLRFTQGFANLGPGPLRVRGVPTGQPDLMHGYQEILDAEGNLARSLPISSIIFHPHHKHWHAGDFASYELRRGSPWGELAAKNGKISYCLVDHSPFSEYTGRYHPPTYLNCKTPSQGLNPGWLDLYEASLYDQWVDVTGVADGVYFLTITGDPQHVYLEADHGDWANNIAWVKVELSDGARQVRVMAPNEILVRLDGKRLEFPVYPRIEENRALAHLRLVEHLGAAVHWDGTKAIVTRGLKRLEITPGMSTALVNGAPVDMGTAALLENHRLLIPVRFLGEQLGFTVTYDPLTATVQIAG